MTQGRVPNAKAAALADRFLVHGYVVVPGPLPAGDIALLLDFAELVVRSARCTTRGADRRRALAGPGGFGFINGLLGITATPDRGVKESTLPQPQIRPWAESLQPDGGATHS